MSIIGQSISDVAVAEEFFMKVLLSRSRLGIEASICLEMDLALLKLRSSNELAAKELIETCRERLHKINSTEPVVFSKFYKASLEYRKVDLTFALYSSSLLMILSRRLLAHLRSITRKPCSFYHIRLLPNYL